MMKHHLNVVSIFLLFTAVHGDSGSENADDKTNTDPHFVENKIDEINKKTDQVKGFIQDIPKFLDSIHAIEKAEKEIADKIESGEQKVRAAQGAQRKKRNIAQAEVAPQIKDDLESLKAENVNILTRDDLLMHSIDYINNTLPEVKAKLVEVLESFLKTNKVAPKSTVHPYENDPDFVFPSFVPHSTIAETLSKYNISLQTEKKELLKLENLILKMQNIVESALLEVYKLEDSLQEDMMNQQKSE